MPIDARIPLMGQQAPPPTPADNPLDVMKQGYNMQGLQAETALRQQQTQQSQQQTQGLNLENQQRQLDLEDQKKIRQAYRDAAGYGAPSAGAPSGTPSPAAPDGSPTAAVPHGTVGDVMDRWLELVAQRGVSPKNLMAVRDSVMGTKQKQATLTEAENKIQAAHGAALATGAQQLLDIKDPAARLAAAPGVIDGMVSTRAIPPEVGAQLKAHIQQTGQISDDDLQDYVAHGQTAMRLDPQQTNTWTRQRTLGIAETRLDIERPGLESQALQRQRDLLVPQLTAARTPAQYDQILGSQPYALVKKLNLPDSSAVFDANGVAKPDAIKALGQSSMNAYQQSEVASRERTAARQEGTEARQDAYQQATLRIREQELEIQRNNAKRTQNQDVRQAQSEIARLHLEENSLNQTRTRLAQAIAGGTTYIDKSGAQKPMATANFGDNTAATDMKNDMIARYRDAGETLKRTTSQIYDQIARAGGRVDVPLPDVYKAVDQTTESTLGQKARDTRQNGQQPPSGLTGQSSQASPANPPASSSNPPPPPPAPGNAPPAQTPASTPPAAPAAPKKSYNVNGTTYTEGQTIHSKGKAYTFRGYQNGKILADPQ